MLLPDSDHSNNTNDFRDIAIMESPPLQLHGDTSATTPSMYDKESLSNSEENLLKSNSHRGRCSKFIRDVDWKQVRSNARAYLNLLLVMAIAYLTIFCIFGEISIPFLYLMLIWQAAHLGGFIFDLIRLPSILGMMFVGFLLRNYMGPILDPLPDTWVFAARQACAVIVVLRAGLEVEVTKLKQLGFSTLRLIFLPGLCETLTVVLLAWSIFHMPIALCFTMGFILAAVGPAIILSGMSDLLGKGYGAGTSVGALLVAASTFDDMVSVCGLSISVGLAYSSGGTGEALLHGFYNLLVGLVGGLVAGMLCWLTTFWNTSLKRIVFLLCVSEAAMFGMWRAELYGAGPLWIVVLGMTAAYGWRYGTLRYPWLAQPGQHPEYVHNTDEVLAVIWEFGAKPMLFGIIGTSIQVANIEPSFVSNSLAIVAAGIPIRVLIAFLALLGTDLSVKERLFCSSAWISKALFQAVFGSLPLQVASTPAQETFGQIILTASVLEIIIMAPLASLVFLKLGPLLLKRVPPPTASEGHEDGGEAGAGTGAGGAGVGEGAGAATGFESELLHRQQGISKFAVMDSLRILHKFD